MNWGSVGEFLAMGGYAGYVWWSYGMAAAHCARTAGAPGIGKYRRRLGHDLVDDDFDVVGACLHRRAQTL